jgi:alpha-1,3-rhamnosyl/mannosyltransferase
MEAERSVTCGGRARAAPTIDGPDDEASTTRWQWVYWPRPRTRLLARTAPLRIGFDATPLHPERGGIGTYTEQLMRSLLLRADAPELVLMSNRPVVVERALPGRVEMRIGPRVPNRGLWVQGAMRNHLDRSALDLVHFPNFLAPRGVGMPHVVTMHDAALLRHPEWFGRTKRWVTRRLLPRTAASADALITVSEFSRREILATLPVDPQRLHVVHEAPADDFFEPITEHERARVRLTYALPRRYVLALGSLEPRKNHRRLLRAMRAVREHHVDVELVFVGRVHGAPEALLRELERGRAEGWLHHLGYVPRSDLRALLADATCMAYPSLYEGFGLPILEALASGTPVVTSSTGAPAEIGRDAIEGVDPTDVDAIATGITRMLDEPALREERCERGRRHAATFSWARAAAETAAVYRRVLGRSIVRRAARPMASWDPELVSPWPRGPVSVSRQADGIFAAILYADLFDYPLAVDELAENTIGAPIAPATAERVLTADPRLRERIDVTDGFVFCRGRGHLVARRHDQAALTDALIREHRAHLARLAGLPFLRMLAFSGGTSHKNSSSRHDLDLFIVTAPGRTWLVYLLIVIVSRVTRCRDAICANYLIDEAHLELPRTGDLFTAHELLYARPVLGEDVRRRMFELNPWIFDRYPNHTGAEPWPVLAADPRREVRRHRWERALRPIASMLDALSRWALEFWVGRHTHPAGGQDVTLTDGVMKLHLHDHRLPFIHRFRRRLEDEGVLTEQTDPVPGIMLSQETESPLPRMVRATP